MTPTARGWGSTPRSSPPGRICRDRLAEWNSVIRELHSLGFAMWRRFTWRGALKRSISEMSRKMLHYARDQRGRSIGAYVAFSLLSNLRECKMKQRFSVVRLVVFVVLVSLWPTLALAAGPDAEQFVRDRHGQLVSLLQQSKSAARDAKVSASIDEVFDYQQLAARSLGDEWSKRSELEQKQFRDLLTQLVRQTYRKSINTTLGYTVEYRGTRKAGDDTVVATVAKHKTDTRKAPVSIDYVLVQDNGTWRAADVIIEGSSLVANYRSQFTRVIKKSGFAELIEKMKRKVKKGE